MKHDLNSLIPHFNNFCVLLLNRYVERLKGMSLLVRAESDGSLLLESRIQPDTAYQKQQGTLIVWSEGENFDLALSFQEKAGCDEIWEKICQVRGVRLLLMGDSFVLNCLSCVLLNSYGVSVKQV